MDEMLEIPEPVLGGERLGAVRATRAAAVSHRAALDRLTRLAARVLDADVSAVSFVEADHQAFDGLHGLGGWAGAGRQTPLTHSLCQYVVARDEPLVITDAHEDPLARETAAPDDLGVRAYAGVPLRTAGVPLGTLCVISTTPRDWTPDELATIADLAAAVESELQLAVAQAEIAELRAALARARTEDRLTGLPDATLAGPEPERTIVRLELDGLDDYEARHGTEEAELLLRRRAAVLVEAMRPYGTAYRAGAAAFAVALLPQDAEPGEAAARAALTAHGPDWFVAPRL